MDIVWLGEGNCHNCIMVGGKGANLCHLASSHRVPVAYCITAEAFAHWMRRSYGDSTALPPGLYAQVAHAYRGLADALGTTEPAVAIRSSALDEDGNSYSFAGQHATYLNVRGTEAVVQATLDCWKSAYSTQALAYRRHHGLSLDSIRMAVLVQQMIHADSSVVAFSANPVTGSQHEIMINASWGLGESIASGVVVPDTYVVCKENLAEVRSSVADKQQMTVPVPNGVRQMPVPRWMRRQPSLKLHHIQDVARLVLALEHRMGWAVDVECAVRHNTLYLLQCRPITALGPVV